MLPRRGERPASKERIVTSRIPALLATAGLFWLAVPSAHPQAHAETTPAAGTTAAPRPAPHAELGRRLVDTTLPMASHTLRPLAVEDASISARSLVLPASAHALHPAPMPDQDVDAPGPTRDALAAQKEASLSPSFYARKAQFAGDGYSAGSTLDEERASRERPGGGMTLNIPMP